MNRGLVGGIVPIPFWGVGRRWEMWRRNRYEQSNDTSSSPQRNHFFFFLSKGSNAVSVATHTCQLKKHSDAQMKWTFFEIKTKKENLFDKSPRIVGKGEGEHFDIWKSINKFWVVDNNLIGLDSVRANQLKIERKEMPFLSSSFDNNSTTFSLNDARGYLWHKKYYERATRRTSVSGVNKYLEQLPPFARAYLIETQNVSLFSSILSR